MSDRADELRTFARAVYGGCSGFVEVAYWTRGRMKSGHVPVEDFVSDPTPALELTEGGVDVYLGCVTLSEKPAKGRGKSSLRLDVPGVWMDLDLAVEGHHKPRDDGMPNLPSVEVAEQLLARSAMPEPTALIHSGGGLYAWWLFEEPLSLQDDESDRALALSLPQAVNEHVAAIARDMGFGMDKLGDIARILRPPGTLNWKRGAMDPRPVRLLYLDEELRVSAESLLDAVADVSLGRRFSIGTAESAGDRSTEDGERGLALPDAVRAASWEELLFPLGWTYGSPVSGATSFLRPGHTDSAGAKPGDGYGGSPGGDDGAKSAGVYADGPEVLVVWSDAAGLPQGSGQKLTKFRVMAHLHFRGNESACSRDLANAAAAHAAGAFRELRSIWPESVLVAAGEFVGTGMTGKYAQRGPWRVTCEGGRAYEVSA